MPVFDTIRGEFVRIAAEQVRARGTHPNADKNPEKLHKQWFDKANSRKRETNKREWLNLRSKEVNGKR